MNKITFVWPEKKAGALTSSWDDGTCFDRPLVEILNKYKVKGTWNLNSSLLGKVSHLRTSDHISASEVKDLYAGHEVGVHTMTHPFLTRQPSAGIISEVILDRQALEDLVGYPVTGLALPCGDHDKRVRQVLRDCGIKYSRPVTKTGKFDLPEDFMDWHTTCHVSDDLNGLWKEFLSNHHSDKLFYLWGHSYEFDQRDEWDKIEDFYKLVSKEDNIWHATNMEIYEYVTAWRNLVCSVNLDSLRNNSGVKLWIHVNDEVHTISPGETLSL